jgi:8-oxo-dGTP pyrophosphatase MutT (NUDIX family)
MAWLVHAERLLRPLIQGFHRWRRGMTLGVRGLVFDSEGRVLLIEHTYVEGWHLPGGGVERGETSADALAREMEEEAGVRLTGPARLLSVHNNDAAFPGDHVLVYRVTDWVACPATSRGEVRRAEWFSPDALPEAVTRGTRARIAEAAQDLSADGLW